MAIRISRSVAFSLKTAAGRAYLRCSTASTSVLDTVAVQIIAMCVQPCLGAFDMVADFRDDLPEPRRVVHFDEVRYLMGGEVVQHIGRREDQPPGERQRTRRCARTPAARLVADRYPPHAHAERLGIGCGRLLQILASFALEVIMHPPLDVVAAASHAEDTLAAIANFSPDRAALAGTMHDSVRYPAQRHHRARKKRRGLR